VLIEAALQIFDFGADQSSSGNDSENEDSA
jgi:hypothetical protein